MLSVGLMSGTSMDGIDAALLETDGSPHVIREIGDFSLSYAPPFKILLKAAAKSVHKHQGDMKAAEAHYGDDLPHFLKFDLEVSDHELSQRICALSQYLHPHEPTRPITLSSVIEHSTYLHGRAIKNLLLKTGYQAENVDVIGYHGQTLFHRPLDKISVIVGDGQLLANLLGITVVNDFRSRDIEAGGQGAPLAPLYHHALAIRDQKIPVAVVNCGGIANITLINSDNELDLIAFDTGPGNGLIDRLVSQRTQGREHMDTDGRYGRQGRVHNRVLTALYAKSIIKDNQNYFSDMPPKSLDIHDMTLIPELNALSLPDACATLEAFTADSIVNSLKLISADIPRHWILAGGGWNNPVIYQELCHRLQRQLHRPPVIQSAADIGWNAQAMEAQIFAYLAVRSLQGKPISVPGVTRVSKPLSGGNTYFPQGCPEKTT